MMRWRRNQSNTRCCMPHFSNPLIYFMTGQLSTFSGLCTLRHFNLQFICLSKIITRNTKSCRSYLFDCRAHGVAICQCFITHFIFTTFAGITFSTNAVHGNCQGCMGLMRNRTKTHGTGCKTFHRYFLPIPLRQWIWKAGFF